MDFWWVLIGAGVFIFLAAYAKKQGIVWGVGRAPREISEHQTSDNKSEVNPPEAPPRD